MVSLTRGKQGSFRWLIVVNHIKKEDKTCWDLYLLELVSKLDFSPCSVTTSPCVCGWTVFLYTLSKMGILLCEDVVGINELMFEMFSDSLL